MALLKVVFSQMKIKLSLLYNIYTNSHHKA